MKVKITAGFLTVVLFANASSAAYDAGGGIVSVVAVSAGIVGTVVAFLPSYGDAGHWETNCGSDVPECSVPICSKVEYCFTTSNLGRPFCWHCHGNGTGDGSLAQRRYEGTAGGLALAVGSILTLVVGVVGSIYYAKTGCTSPYEQL